MFHQLALFAGHFSVGLDIKIIPVILSRVQSDESLGLPIAAVIARTDPPTLRACRDLDALPLPESVRASLRQTHVAAELPEAV
jgi:hypothetical protein